ncbi:uncharacterized protein LOC120158437 [Hibiscus syriacus]|uniref:uncharacterized protein LOC120158437 n=1 Tax=Hibiscus syriacus TaxID=106335 RepID=UPI0019221CC1|nr:uncharacterized protein LOC120158437 [Hibiscus syriacus]
MASPSSGLLPRTNPVSTRELWIEFRSRENRELWHKLVWLATKYRLRRMGLMVDDKCILCGVAAESRRNVGSWDFELAWAISSLKGRSLRTLVLKLAWSSLVYLVWEERNRRVFRNVNRSVEDVTHLIKNTVQLTLHGRKGNPH